MKRIGTMQLRAMKFERLDLSEDWKKHLGNLPVKSFVLIAYGESGEGKTEYMMQLAKELMRFGKVEWLGYETGHDADIQDAEARNNLNGVIWTDPWEKRKPEQTIFDDIAGAICRRKGAKYIFIDSYDATKLLEEEIMELHRLAKKKNKCLLWIAHAKGKKEPQKTVAQKIEFYGHVGIYVKHYIATPMKNRYGGWDERIIYEERARDRNPLFFAKREEAAKASEPKRKRKTKKPL